MAGKFPQKQSSMNLAITWVREVWVGQEGMFSTGKKLFLQ
jgi:hypothetical protein